MNEILSFETILEMGDKKDKVCHLNMIFLTNGNAVG